MCPAIDNSTSCKIRTVIHFLHAKMMSAVEIHRELFVVSDDLFQSERRRFTISELSCEFPQISRNLLYEIITVRLCCRKFCVRWVPKMLTGAHKKQRTASTLTLLEQ
jgi:hypothetical protein